MNKMVEAEMYLLQFYCLHTDQNHILEIKLKVTAVHALPCRISKTVTCLWGAHTTLCHTAASTSEFIISALSQGRSGGFITVTLNHVLISPGRL